MNTTNLVVLPGGGNPDTPLYSKVYSVISREARSHGYEKVFCSIRWPGHCSEYDYNTSPAINLSSAVKVAIKFISSLPEGPFALLGRSFGCFVALRLAISGDLDDKKPTKIVLWGPPPYWLIWEMFVRDLKENQKRARSKGLKVDETFHSTIEPVESLIQKVSIRTIVATGTEDPYCIPAYLEYLRSIAIRNNFVSFKKPVQGAPHEVTDDNGSEVVKEYAKTIFE